MRANLSDRAKSELLDIMKHYGYTSTSHALNVIVGNLHKSIFTPSLKEGKLTYETSTIGQTS